MTAYDRWLEAPYQEQCEREDAIDSLAEELLESECDPKDIDVFLSAIDDCCLYAAKEQIAEAIAKGYSNTEAIGKAIWNAVYEYCKNEADSIAADRYNSGLRNEYEPD